MQRHRYNNKIQKKKENKVNKKNLQRIFKQICKVIMIIHPLPPHSSINYPFRTGSTQNSIQFSMGVILNLLNPNLDLIQPYLITIWITINIYIHLLSLQSSRMIIISGSDWIRSRFNSGWADLMSISISLGHVKSGLEVIRSKSDLKRQINSNKGSMGIKS